MLKWRDILRLTNDGNLAPDKRVEKTPEQWQMLLDDDVYNITRNKGTERPFSSGSCTLFESGKYACVCCDNLLFNAYEKFDSGSGWPSFTQPAAENAIAYIGDNSHAMQRVEIVCNVCDAHLGHVFPDGPKPSGLRYCVNALSMVKV
ncbi:peptide-methionine (R)-S-oxide reductase MsrB [Pseudoalteromonas aurantia]|uniref:Peptide methionine sulfoxide reductase MsrB n=1 Tax=Pseudoalteromonas aurantia TaxID=43654 RepID=A0A5S3V9S3_9GAMM|nr:peptide-methionine (R)-S-oxide reductase MsrB [Pseudoalteromonas aurantia]TMO61325.1 peptide-methionine (R)-S-oxide reductase [Pseudoalteromonas aurantia]TMO68150.1 peptide-methionine (R)-S-oxide reductase [Pseudoalteromonas aurantia]TMO72284.1 peptide-methionine (R)-S-oxide reductase [Pseudoalteromonas aurantia]